MSDIIKIARQAPKVVEGLLADMFAANAEDNRIALGGVYSGQQYIQLQLVATSNPADLLDDDGDEDDEETAPLPAHSPLTTHWLATRAEFIAAGGEARGDRDISRELLALGAAFWVYARHATDGEVIELHPQGLRVQQEEAGQVVSEWFDPARVRVGMPNTADDLIEIRSGSRLIKVGRYLRPEVRLHLGQEIRQALMACNLGNP
jgi:hypothetical protein